jgi:hypothetical protein
MVTNLLNELVCAASGADCDALLAWYKLDAATDMATLRACAHWAACTDEQQNEIAGALGISQAVADDALWPTYAAPNAVRADYKAALDRAYTRLA